MITLVLWYSAPVLLPTARLHTLKCTEHLADHISLLFTIQDLCHAALTFAFDTLSAGGNFLCKFYQGEEDKALELRLKKLFDKTYRIKPDSSRKESKEAYLVGLRRKGGAVRNEVLGGG